MMKKLLLTLSCATVWATSTNADGLNLTIDGLRNDQGHVLIMVFDDADTFNRLDVWNAVDYAAVPARSGRITHSFEPLTDGPYAVIAFHDENDDEDLNATDTHLLEGVGASGAPNASDDPDFAAASVWPGNVTVRIHYDQ